MERKSLNLNWGLNPDQIAKFHRAHKQGFDAARRGLSYFQNPHIVGTVKYDAWHKGWHAAQKDNSK